VPSPTSEAMPGTHAVPLADRSAGSPLAPPTGSGPLVYERPEPAQERDSPAEQHVWLPRRVVYIQGFLLGAVALLFFVFGLIVGSRSTRDNQSGAPGQPCVVSGTVVAEGPAGESMPDAGSVVILLPATARPDQKASAKGLLPQDKDPEDDHPSLSVIRQLGGDFAKADRRGQFRLRAPSAARYYLLVVSRARQRSDDEPPASRDLAQIGRYFSSASDLLGRQKYQWTELLIHKDRDVDVTIR